VEADEPEELPDPHPATANMAAIGKKMNTNLQNFMNALVSYAQTISPPAKIQKSNAFRFYWRIRSDSS
jgi:hypothetical protein